MAMSTMLRSEKRMFVVEVFSVGCGTLVMEEVVKSRGEKVQDVDPDFI
jgi:hypothetical protein